MQEYPATRRCGRCTAPALFRLALVDVDERPTAILTRRAHYRCAPCFLDSLDPAALVRLNQRQLVVVDPTFTATVLPVAAS